MNPSRVTQALQEALALHQAGQLEAAAAGYARIRAAVPRNFDAAHLAGTLELQQGRLEAAAATLAEARRLDPRSAVCALRLGIALGALGRPVLAEVELRAALKLEAGLPEAWFHLGRTLEQRGRIDEAVAATEQALALRAAYAEASDQLGALLAGSRGHAAAEPCFRRATEQEPGFARAWCNLGISLVYLGRLTEAITCLDRALALDPKLHHAWAGRGLALERCYRIREAVNDYGRAVEGDPGNHQARSARLMALHYLGGIPRLKMRREHEAFGAVAEGATPAPARAFPPASERRLRVGFLSPNLRTHSVAHFLEPLLAHLDREQFEVFLYHDHPLMDATSARLRQAAAHWRHVAGQPHGALEVQVRADSLDLLVDLAGHTELNRLPLFARRLAPVQATYLGYPDTTGLRSMDYRLVDAITDPEGAEELCTEELVRFAPTAWCYAPPAEAPLRSPPPSAGGEPVTFGCFNNFAKVTDETLAAWGRVLAAVPGSRLLLKSFGLGAPVLQAAALRRLAAAGIAPGRAELLDHTASLTEHLATYARVDISLDTFPYHGTTTTCEALWMGVPVVTRVGDRHASRVGASLLTAVGHPEWIARDWEEYVGIAAALARDPDRLAATRAGLRDELRNSPLLDHVGQAERFGAALAGMCRPHELAVVPAETCGA
jgi:protein O-GlcNAc transferase